MEYLETQLTHYRQMVDKSSPEALRLKQKITNDHRDLAVSIESRMTNNAAKIAALVKEQEALGRASGFLKACFKHPIG
jgi:hypothetical protein